MPLYPTINSCHKILHHKHHIHSQIQPLKSACDVFINHRGIDTKKTISGLLFDRVSGMELKPFLDIKNMKPGDKLLDHINAAIHGCKVGVAVFSPRYCESYFCLYELALLMECKKRVIPIFYDVKPSELHVENYRTYPPQELQRFESSLKEAQFTVGLTFNSKQEDWSEFLTMATEAIMKNLIEVDGEKLIKNGKQNHFLHSPIQSQHETSRT